MTSPHKNYFLISGLMLLLALFQLPYFYYQFLRWLVCLLAIIIVYKLDEQSLKIKWPLIIIAVVFNPVCPFYLGTLFWKITDLLKGLWFIFLYIKKNN